MNEAPSIEPISDEVELTPAQKGAITKAKNLAKKEVKVEPLVKTYKNKTLNNIFTEAGCCRPQKTIGLTTEQADKYTGLELCPNK